MTRFENSSLYFATWVTHRKYSHFSAVVIFVTSESRGERKRGGEARALRFGAYNKFNAAPTVTVINARTGARDNGERSIIERSSSSSSTRHLIPSYVRSCFIKNRHAFVLAVDTVQSLVRRPIVPPRQPVRALVPLVRRIREVKR